MTDVSSIASAIETKQKELGRQILVAIAGAPASGKSTLAVDLEQQLDDAIILGMDGFHYDNLILTARNLAKRKGAPESFDVAGFVHTINRIQASENVVAPLFDRELDLARAGAVEITQDHKIVLVEGNYLLLDEDPWRELHNSWDMTIKIDMPIDVLRERLVHRWMSLDLGIEKAHARADKNDIPNAERVISNSIDADLTVGQVELT